MLLLYYYQVIACTKALVLGHPLPARTFRKPQWDVGDESLSPPQLGPTKEKCGVGKEKALKQIARAELDPSSVAAQRLRKRKETNKIEDGQFNQRVPDSSLLLLSRDENEDGGMYFLPPPSWTANVSFYYCSLMALYISRLLLLCIYSPHLHNNKSL